MQRLVDSLDFRIFVVEVALSLEWRFNNEIFQRKVEQVLTSIDAPSDVVWHFSTIFFS